MNAKMLKKAKTCVCVVCKATVRKRDAVPYGASPVCVACDREMRDESKERERFENDMELQSLRDRLGW